MEESKSYKIFRKIIDDNFEIDHLHHYQLSVQLSPNHFRFCVIDTTQDRCMLIEDYTLSPFSASDDYVKILNTIFEDHVLLSAGFWKKVRVSIKNLKFSLVPSSLFDANNAHKYLNVVHQVDNENDVLYHFKHQSNEMVNVFVAEKKIIQWFKDAYPGKNIEVIHDTSLFIEALLQNNFKVASAHRAVYASIESQMMTVVLKDGTKVEFCNNFKVQSDTDVLYFLLFIYEELELDTNSTPLYLTGNVDSSTDVYKKIYKYIRNVDFSPRTQSLKFSYKFDELMDHQYYDLFALHLC